VGESQRKGAKGVFVTAIVTGFGTGDQLQVARAPGCAVDEVAAFCRPSILAVTDTVVDTLYVPQLLLRSVSYDPAWLWGKDKLLLTGPTSAGDLKALDYSVRGSFTARTSGDSVIVRYPREAVVWDVLGALLQLYGAIDLASRLIR